MLSADLTFPRRTSGNAKLKRLLDIVCALGGLLVVAPLLAVVALAVLLDDGRPVLFRQERVGRNGTRFDILKFRSMRVQPHGAGPLLTAAGDSRLTRVGRVIRRWKLDELPQLLNVLRGEMSLVGPRPITLDELPRYGQVRWHYLSVRPGMTGLWQVSGRNDTTYAERVELDRRFVEDSSLRMRFGILVRTLRVVVLGSGAR